MIDKNMKKLMVSLLFIIGLCACKNKNEVIENSNEQSSRVSTHYILHPTIMEIVKEFQLNEQNDKIYAVYFTDEKEKLPVLGIESDTLVYVSFLKEDYALVKNVTYKGVLAIDSIVIAIFDTNGYGSKYYDSTKLSPIPQEILNTASKKERTYFTALEVVSDHLERIVAP